jgi:hypothetical protein
MTRIVAIVFAVLLLLTGVNLLSAQQITSSSLVSVGTSLPALVRLQQQQTFGAF